MKKVEHTIPASFAQDNQLIWSEWSTPGLVLFLASLFMAGLYWDTVQSMVSVWSTSRTFAHGYLVLPAAGYLIWCYRPLWMHQVPVPSLWGLGAVVLLEVGWLIGSWADVLWLQQAAVVAMLPGLLWAIVGEKIFGAVAWPLGFLFFMLPVGTSIEPWLQDFTAWFVQAGLRLAQIPHFSDNGHQIVITTGVWEVARDCGGLRYLLPGLALAAAFAMLIYRQPFRRLAFLVLCAGTLMIANGVRAYGVIIGDYFGIADGTDHRMFSYTIYGLTIPLLFWIGLKWSDTGSTASMEDRVVARQGGFDTRKNIAMAIAAVSILAIGRLSVWLWFSHR
jgi:exosortase A